MALSAELNGIPGPSHLLALTDEIALSADQVAEIQAIFAGMKTEAVAAGDRLIAAEEAIDKSFAGGELDERRPWSMTQLLRGLICASFTFPATFQLRGC